MKNKIHVFFLLCWTFSTSVIVAAKTTFGQVGKMVVSGRVLNADKHPDKKVVQLQFRDLLRDEGTKSTVELDAEGRFRLEAQLPFAQDMYLDYGNLKTLFCRPGDSLYLELDADNPKIIRTFKGRSAAINVHIQAFLQGLPTQKFQGQSLIDAQKKLDETGYIQFLEARRTVYSDYLNGFLRANKTDVDFRRWANQYIEFGVYEDRLRYRWTHPHYNGMNKDSFQLSSGYYSFLQKAMQDDYDLVTLQQESFMGEVFNYSM